MATDKKKETAAERNDTLTQALKQPGAVLMEDAIKASKQRITAHNDAMVAAGAIQGTTAAAPTGSTAVTGTTSTSAGASVGGTVGGGTGAATT